LLLKDISKQSFVEHSVVKS